MTHTLFRRRHYLGLVTAAAVWMIGCGGSVVSASAPAARISPTSVTLAAGQQAAFTASFTGKAPVAVNWSASGGVIKPNPNAHNANHPEGDFIAGSTPGTYTVSITAEGGDTDTATATVTVVPAPPPPSPAMSATIAPASATVTAGQSAAFTASFSNGTPTSVTWSGAGGSLTQVSANPDQASFTAGAAAGTYTITVTGAGASPATATATVTVLAATAPPPPPPPPAMTASIAPASTTVTAGQSVTFTASFANGTPTSINWTATGGAIVPASGASTTASYTAGSSAGTYTVTVTGSGSSPATSTATVKVTAAAPPPAMTASISPASTTVTAGQSVAFTASFANGTPTSINWGATGGTVTASAGASTTATYTAGSTAGTYTVTVTGVGNPSATATATVKVTAAPPPPAMTASLSPSTATVTAGQSAAFTATFSNGTPSSVSWTATGGTVTPASGNPDQASFTAGSTAGTYTVTVTGNGSSPATAHATITVAAAPAPAPAPSSGRLFPSSSANWLYSAPTGTGLNISSVTSGMSFQVNTHSQGFDYPVEYTDGSHGCTNFTDTLQYAFTDHPCVPNPANGYWPSVGGWGANDGHLIVVDTATSTYYDFWKLYVNSSGQPTSTNVGGIFTGSLNGNGTPGTTAADITGLAGDILPGELDCSTCLQHALSVIVPSSMDSNLVGTQSPADHHDGSVAGAIFREGSKIRFDPSINVDSLSVSTAVKAIMKALQQYGGVITDQTGGSQIAFYSALPTAPDLTGINQIGQHLLVYY